MMQTLALLALAATGASGFVVPSASFGPRAWTTSATRQASSLQMVDAPLGVGVIGCGRIGDVSSVPRGRLG